MQTWGLRELGSVGWGIVHLGSGNDVLRRELVVGFPRKTDCGLLEAGIRQDPRIAKTRSGYTGSEPGQEQGTRAIRVAEARLNAEIVVVDSQTSYVISRGDYHRHSNLYSYTDYPVSRRYLSQNSHCRFRGAQRVEGWGFESQGYQSV